jgi:HPt (histidine-containing phosphotransfer) domain-containing protein
MNHSPLSPLLDSSRFETLLINVGPELRRIFDSFLVQCAEAIDALSAGNISGDIDQVRAIAHKMKGSCSSLGLSRLEASFRDLETDCRNGKSAAADWLSAAARHLEDSRQEIDRHLPSSS